jgi:hypothetical protein
MINAVCTLAEDAHLEKGAGALLNSLWRSGFRGDFHVGYRGTPPRWLGIAGEESTANPPGTPGIVVRLHREASGPHLTNRKADFMRELFADNPGMTGLIYLDPDIVCDLPWSYLADWAQCGILLCEDVYSPLPTGHPRRCGWRRSLAEQGITLAPRFGEYANGGMVGLTRGHADFLRTWSEIQAVVSRLLGGDHLAAVGGPIRSHTGTLGFANCWDLTDQDALNAAVEARHDIPVSMQGRSMMGASHGFCFSGLPHAHGRPKPWKKRFIIRALQGFGPGPADRAYWKYAGAPLRIEGAARRLWVRFSIPAAAALGRFYRRGPGI